MVNDQLAKGLADANETTGVVGIVKLVIGEVEPVERKLAVRFRIGAVNDGYLH